MNRRPLYPRLVRLPLLAALLAAAPPLEAQSGPMAASASFTAREGGSDRSDRALQRALRESKALARDRYAVIIDLDHNQLHFRKGSMTLWSAPIGTGTGLRMKSGDKAWDFSTPTGTFHVKRKELNPDWIAPNWYFVENGLPIPPENDPKRIFPGGLGAAAVYLEHDLAIHGTDKPELLGQRVSHGCIRLANKDALRLFHNLQVGTEVIIVGGEELPQKEVTPQEIRRQAAATFSPSSKRTAPKDPVVEKWRSLPTEDLLLELEDELWAAKSSRWPEVASLLMERGLRTDDLALAGLMAAALDLPSARIEREFKTYLADAFTRGKVRTMEVLSRLRTGDRDRVAAIMVEAVMELYHGEFSESSAPWPTRSLPRTVVSAEGRRGWLAMQQAEESFGSRTAVRSTR